MNVIAAGPVDRGWTPTEAPGARHKVLLPRKTGGGGVCFTFDRGAVSAERRSVGTAMFGVPRQTMVEALTRATRPSTEQVAAVLWRQVVASVGPATDARLGDREL